MNALSLRTDNEDHNNINLYTMKKGIHPENYRLVAFKDMSNGTTTITKSTAATKETIEIDGVDVRKYDLKILRENIGVVLQKSELFTGTIFDNIRWGKPDATLEEVREAARIAQADDFIMSFSEQYNTVIGEKGSSLSGGQKQRICIARAILKNPKVLIFDDATSALDLATEARLYKALKEYMNDVTIILIAQRVASAKGAEKIIVLDDGVISGIGTNDELLENNEIYKDIYYSQLKANGGEDYAK